MRNLRRDRPGRRVAGASILSLIAGLVVGTTVTWSALDASANGQRSSSSFSDFLRPSMTSTVHLRIRPAPHRPTPSPTCDAVVFEDRTYCAGGLPEVIRGAYGVGDRRVIQGVSVTAVTAPTQTQPARVRLEALDYGTPCPPGHFCGAGITSVSLTLDWTIDPLPPQGRAINLFGRTTGSSMLPDGFTASDACYIDWC